MAMHTHTRRGLIGAIAVAPLAMVTPAQAGPTPTTTTTIGAAFAEWKSTWRAYNAVPIEDETPESEKAFWDRTDHLEAVIRDAVARGPADVAAKLWVALAHTALGHTAHEDIATAADMNALRQVEPDLGYEHRLIVSAIIALEGLAA